MSFRQYGGINYASRNNIVKNNYTNANNLSVMTKVGQPSSIINVDSGLYGLAGDITFKQLSEPFYGIVFSDNTKQTTAITTTDSFWQPYDSAPTPIIYYTNRVLIGADPSQISGTINASTKLAVNGNIAANGNLYAAYVSSGTGFNTFSVIGASGNTSISGTLGVSGATNLTSTLGVSGATNLSSTLGVSGATNLTSTLGVSGDTNLSSTLGVSGATNLSSTLGVSGATNLSSTLGVSGATNLSSTLGVSGFTNLNNGLQVMGTANPFTSLGSINRLSHIPDAGSGSINYITVAGDNMLYLGGNSSGAPSNSVITNWSSVCSGLRWNGNTSLYLGMGGSSNVPSNNITFNASTNSVAISTNGATRMTIDSGGNVGIGTTTPTSKLSVTNTNIAINSLYLTSGTLGTSLGDRSLISSYYTNVTGNGTYIDTYAYRYASGTSWDTTASTIIQSKIDTTPEAMIEFNPQGYPGGIAITNSGRIGIHIDTNGIPSAPTATAGTNNTQIATTAFVTTAVASGGGGSQTTSTLKYTANTTFNTPTGCRFIDIQVIGAGGSQGASDVGPPVFYGGAGSGGNMASITGFAITANTSLTLSFVAGDTTGYVQISYTGASVLTNIAKVFNGNGGDPGLSGSGQSGGTSNFTASVINSRSASAYVYAGTAGLASTVSGGGSTIAPATAGTGTSCPNGCFTYQNGLFGCGGTGNTSKGGGLIVITYHLGI